MGGSDVEEEKEEPADLIREREIEGVLYRSQPVAFREGLRGLVRLFKILSPVVSATFRQTGVLMYADAISAIGEVLTDGEVEYFSTLFSKASWYQKDDRWVPLVSTSKIDNLGLHFHGRYLEFLRWLVFNVEVNYSGFFAGARDAEGGLGALLKKMNLSTGSAPGSGLDGGS